MNIRTLLVGEVGMVTIEVALNAPSSVQNSRLLIRWSARYINAIENISSHIFITQTVNFNKVNWSRVGIMVVVECKLVTKLLHIGTAVDLDRMACQE